MIYCKRCILNEKIPHIIFDENGECNYCKIHDDNEKCFPQGEKGERILKQKISEAKNVGKNNRYDCLVGISGGADSTYALLQVVKRGLRPLAVYLDNSWSSEIAVSNIKNVTEILDVDLHVEVLNWVEFRDLLRSFLKASVPDIDIPTDIAIKSILYRVAKKYKIQYIVSGANFRTEGQIPKGWTYMDGKYIRSVHKLFGKVPLKTYPNLTFFDYIKFTFFNNLKVIPILNYIDYEKEHIKKIIIEECGWKDYGGKHFESIFTRFNQSIHLYDKFNIDKREIEYAALVRSGQISRASALDVIKERPRSIEKIKEDIAYVSKKLKFSDEEMKEILERAPKSYHDYPTYAPMIESFRPIVNFVQKFITRL